MKPNSMIKHFLTLCLVFVVAIVSVGAKENSFDKQFLSEVLNKISEEHQVIITYNAKLVAGIRIDFEFRSGEALESAVNRALISTDLNFRQLTEKYFVVFNKRITTRNNLKKLKRRFIKIQELERKQGFNVQRLSGDAKVNFERIVVAVDNLPAGATITGKVVENDTGEGVIGATVLVEGTQIATTTDIDGNYSIEANPTDYLVFSYIGLKNERVQVGDQKVVDVTMYTETSILDEVIVVAFGSVKKGDNVGSAETLNAEQLGKRVLSNITNAAEGAAGVQMVGSDGQPGSSASIRVRGYSDLGGGSDPLYIVDGAIYGGGLSTINIADVESFTILKDASSTALYGNKAANGVVLITTKQGRKGKDQFNIDISSGFSGRAIKEIDRVSAEQYYPLMWEGYRNGLVHSQGMSEADANVAASAGIFRLLGTNPFNVPNDQIVGTDGLLNPNAQHKYADDLDWQAPLVRNGDRQNVDLSYSGGTDKTSFFASVGYLKEEGWVIKSDYERISARLNVTTNATEWLKTGINLSGVTWNNNSIGGGSNSLRNPFFSTRRIAPIYPVHLHDPATGGYILDGQSRIFDEGVNRIGSSIGRNVIQETLLDRNEAERVTLSGRIFTEITFMKDFKLTLNASNDRSSMFESSFRNPLVGDGAPGGRASKDLYSENTLNFNQLLRWDKDFGNHSVSFLIGHESYSNSEVELDADRQDVIAANNIELINFATLSGASSSVSKYKSEGYLSRVEYNFDKTYFLSGSVRRDGSSRFHPDVRWGNFWSIGAAWRLDNEDFIKSVDWIDGLKLRASYGQVGNDGSASRFASQPLFELGFNNDTEPGILLNTLGSETLTWENNTQSDIALEFSLFDFRISGVIEYYNRKTEDLIASVPLPESSGIESFLDNIGSLSNKGIEIQIAADIIRTKNFRWNLDVNASTIDNEILELSQPEIIDGTKKLVVGGSIYDYYLRDFYGVDPADGAALYTVDPEVDQNDVDIRMVNGVAVTTDQEDALRTFVGTAIPDILGGIKNRFSYKNFELDVLLTYSLGGLTYDGTYAALLQNGKYGTALATDILNRWQKPGDITNVPRLDDSQQVNFDASSSRFLISRDNINLAQVSLAYDIPKNIINKWGVKSVKLYANGSNLWRKAARNGLDTNQRLSGTTTNRFTPSRLITFGAKVGF